MTISHDRRRRVGGGRVERAAFDFAVTARRYRETRAPAGATSEVFIMRFARQLAVLALITVFCGAAAQVSETDVKACWLYVGPVGDYGFSYAQDLGRKATAADLPGITTAYVEAVAEADVEATVDQLVADGCNVVLGTSFGFGDGLLAAAERYPDVIFGHATGVERAPNLLTYMADFYQVYYVNGLIAGGLSSSGIVGYIGAFPIPEVKRHIDAFAIGVKEANPDAKVVVRWLYNWFDPAGAKEATEALIADGADVFAFTEDTPTVAQTAAAHGYPSFSHYASMLPYAPDTIASGQLVNWGVLTTDILSKVIDGTYTSTNLEDVDYFWLLAQGAVEVGAEPGMVINPAYEEALKERTVELANGDRLSVYDLALLRIEQMATDPVAFDPFTGPVYDRKGNLVYAAGVTPSVGELLGLQWAADNVEGPWEGEP